MIISSMEQAEHAFRHLNMPVVMAAIKDPSGNPLAISVQYAKGYRLYYEFCYCMLRYPDVHVVVTSASGNNPKCDELDIAIGLTLDVIGAREGFPRKGEEADQAYRARLKQMRMVLHG